MNVREGMRRLGLVAGVLGASVGAIVAYDELQPLLAQRAQYKAFQSLVASRTVQKEVEFLKTSLAQGCTNCRTDPETGVTLDFGAAQPIDISAGLVPKAEPTPKGRKQSIVSAEPIRGGSPKREPAPIDFSKYAAQSGSAPATLPASWFDEVAAVCGEVNGWKVNKDGIKAIHFDGKSCAGPPTAAYGGHLEGVSAGEISMIETGEGQPVYRTEPSAFRSYLLIAVFPILGFLLPWGAIRVLTWIGMGFSYSWK